MSRKKAEADLRLDELFSEISREDDEDLPPEFYAHEMERVIRRKKELDAQEAAEKIVRMDQGKKAVRRDGHAGPRWKIALSVAAVFLFLILGTLLTGDSLRKPGNTPNPGGRITLIETPDSTTGFDGKDIVDTSEVRKRDEQESGFGRFMGNMWLFTRAALPYLGGAAVCILVILYAAGKKKRDKGTNP